ncbi:MAG: hypothetical protein FWG87_11100 [Defluviitaleaceae bacterium]|nr:hypothetical protein [Defluviitaleaceae bacterium]
MVKTKELLIILIFLGVAAAAMYYWLYLIPKNNAIAEWDVKIEERRKQIDDDRAAALDRQQEKVRLTAQRAEFSEDWAREAAALPERFSDVEVLRHIQEVIYPHTDKVSLNFNESVERAGDEIWSTSINLSFSTSYWQFLSILHNLVAGELGNRVINYSLRVSEIEPGDFRAMVEPVLDTIPAEILSQFLPDFRAYYANRNVDFMGMYMLDVSMEVEYLSIYAGMLSVGDMAAEWEAEDIMLAELIAALEGGQ